MRRTGPAPWRRSPPSGRSTALATPKAVETLHKGQEQMLMAAQQDWRRVNAPHLVALVKAAVEVPDGEAEMLQCDPESEELLILAPESLAADGVPIHAI